LVVLSTLAYSVEQLSVQLAVVVGLAIAALVLTGWRKPARAQPRRRRADSTPDWAPIVVDHQPVPLYRRPGPLRRLFAAVTSTGLALVTGAVLATVIGFAVAYAVITLTGLLRS
jgi:hypothetical protein